MNWYFLAAINVVTAAGSAVFQKIAMKSNDSDPVAFSIIFQFLLAIIVFLFALTMGYHLPPLSLLPYFLGSGILYAIGTVSFFRSLQTIGASDMTIIGSSGTIYTIIFSSLFLGETINIGQGIGVLLILSSIFIVNMSGTRVRFDSGHKRAAIGALCYGSAVVFDSYIIKHFDAVSFLPIASLTPGIFILLSSLKNFHSVIHATQTIRPPILLYTLIYAVQAISFYLAIQQGATVSQISTIARASIILTILFAAVFLHEQSHIKRNILAAVLTTAGVILVSV